MRSAFLLLVTTQAAHSLEEYFGRLWEVFAPARFLSGLVSRTNLEFGFLVINIGLVVLGIVCYFGVVRRGLPSARAWIWFWVVLESINGVGHTVWAAASGGYRPGLLSALPFLVLVPVLLRELLASRRSSPA